MARWDTCNIFKTAAGRQLWQFTPDGDNVKLVRTLGWADEEPAPRRHYAKGWGHLLRKRLNVGWMPPGSVFLRVVHLPVVEDPAELLSMVEFQLEKLSPIPVGQIVWSIEVLSPPVEGQVTVIVLIAARQQVEACLGQLEAQGFMADRLEAPVLDLLLLCDPSVNGVWIFPPQEGTHSSWMAAWWYGGVLRHIGLVHLPDGEQRQLVLQDQLRQMAWAGELEGWLTEPPKWHLVADAVSASLWEPMVRAITDQDVQVIISPPPAQVAAKTARRLLAATPGQGLLPADMAAQYRARFVDQLWMSGLGTLMMVYLACVVAYVGAVKFYEFKLGRAKQRVAALQGAYNNAMQKRALLQIMEDQQKFKYAALDSWEAIARCLPMELTLKSMSLSREKTISLYGVAPADQSAKITEFNAALKQFELFGQPLFVKVAPPRIGGAGGNLNWDFTCELNRLETRE